MRIAAFLFLVFTHFSYADTERLSFTSKFIDETVTVQISLPDTYRHSDSFKYPLLLTLDGSMQFNHITASNQFLSSYAITPEMITVGVSVLKRMQYFTPTEHEQFIGRSGQAHLFKAFLQQELIPKLKEKYRIAPYYSISGHSLGGLFTSYLALQKDAIFQNYISISPSLWWDNGSLIKHYKTLQSTHFNAARSWFLSMASEPGEMIDNYTKMLDALNTQPLANLTWHSERFANDTHDSTPLPANMSALKTLFKDWNAIPEIDVMPLGQIHAFYQQKSQQYGYNMPLGVHQYNVYGLKAAYEGKTQWGVEILEKGVQVFNKSEILWDSLATAYTLNKQSKQALDASKTAVKLAKANSSLFLNEILSQNKQLSKKEVND